MKKLFALGLFGLILGLASANTGDNLSGYNASGFNASGFNASGFNASGFNASGFNASGFNASGFNASGFNASGFNASGFNASGFNASGFNASGFNQSGHNRSGYGNNFKKIRWNEFNDDLNKVLKFIDRKNLSKEDRKAVGKIILQTRKDLKAIYKQIKTEYLAGSPLDLTGYITKLTTEFTDFTNQLDKYVMADKKDDLTRYKEDKINKVTSNLKSGMKYETKVKEPKYDDKNDKKYNEMKKYSSSDKKEKYSNKNNKSKFNKSNNGKSNK